MIPKNISKADILQAIEEAEISGIPERRQSRKYLLEYKGKYYPPKYIVSLANKYANGRELSSEEFEGGNETNQFLRARGFSVLSFGESSPRSDEGLKPRTPPPGTRNHNERCPACKETVPELLIRLFGRVERNWGFDLGTQLQTFEPSDHFRSLADIYAALQEYRGFEDFVRSANLPPCDYFVPDLGFIVEFDESQHFPMPRQLTLERYPSELAVGFDVNKWITLCKKIKARDNDPPYRDEQRAYYDALRDFLPSIKGLKPTVRLFSTEIKWCDLNPDRGADLELFRQFFSGEPRAGVYSSE